MIDRADATTPPARVAVVTGGGRGLGRQVALGLAADGVAVGLIGRTPETLEAVRLEIEKVDGRAAAAVADVRSYSELCAAMASVTGQLGDVDLLVNNAAVIEPVEVPIWEADPTAWWNVVETDLRGPFHAVRAVVPSMLTRGGGRVVDVNSGAGAGDRRVYSAYSAAKAGLFRIAGNLHVAGFDLGLRAFEISPGVVRTDMTAAMPMHERRTDWTPVESFVALVVAAARGELDAWSGCYLYAGTDTPQSLAAAAAVLGEERPPPARRLGVRSWGEGDPFG